jgi:EAL domain-containing protein (putative c-di-GMP-specific phosphodiesterase class I)
METTSEGIESQEELDYVKEVGCTEGQGNFFSKPRPAKDLYPFSLFAEQYEHTIPSERNHVGRRNRPDHWRGR